MNRFLQYFNVVGVCVLVGVCVGQWRENRRLNLQNLSVELERRGLEESLAALEKTSKRHQEDLKSYTARYTQNAAQLAERSKEAVELRTQVRVLELKREQVQTAVTEWSKAVASRDERLNEVQSNLTQLMNERTELAKRWNAQVEKYNELVRTLDDVTRRYNDLAAATSAIKATTAPPPKP